MIRPEVAAFSSPTYTPSQSGHPARQPRPVPALALREAGGLQKSPGTTSPPSPAGAPGSGSGGGGRSGRRERFRRPPRGSPLASVRSWPAELLVGTVWWLSKSLLCILTCSTYHQTVRMAQSISSFSSVYLPKTFSKISHFLFTQSIFYWPNFW